MEITSLCIRASSILSSEEKEKLWFQWLEIVLTRPQLGPTLKTALHSASSHVDLTHLVQLVLRHRAQEGDIGDIRDILVCMLSNSKYESVCLNGTSRILATDLHEIFEKAKRKSNRGLCIKSIKCVVCRNRLKQPMKNVIVLGSCGHALHEACFELHKELISKVECPRCSFDYGENVESLSLPETSQIILEGVKLQSGLNLETRTPTWLQNRN